MLEHNLVGNVFSHKKRKSSCCSWGQQGAGERWLLLSVKDPIGAVLFAAQSCCQDSGRVWGGHPATAAGFVLLRCVVL